MRRWIAVAGMCVAVPLQVVAVSAGESPTAEAAKDGLQLRIATKLFVNNNPRRAEPLSLFYEGAVFDYLGEEVTIFEPDRKRFTLVRAAHRLACQITFEQIEAQLKRSREESQRGIRQLEQTGDAESLELARLGRFLLAPTFEEHWEPQQRRLTLQGRYLVYRVEGEPLDGLGGPPRGAEARKSAGDPARALREFWDWYARLNHMVNPGALPPGARLALNRKLAEHKIAPREVHLSIHFGEPLEIRTTHAMSPQLLSSDLQRIEATRRSLDAAKFVSLKLYQEQTRSQQ